MPSSQLGNLKLGNAQLGNDADAPPVQPTTGSAGISSQEGFGATGVVTGPLTGSAGIVSEEGFGTTGAIATSESLAGGAGITSDEAFGADGELDLNIAGSAGIITREAFGSTGIVAGPLTGSSGIPTAEGFGAVGGELSNLMDGLDGIESGEAFGADGEVRGPITGTAGIISRETFGAGGSVAGPISGTAGIISRETFGAGGTAAISGPITGAAGIPSLEAFGAGGEVKQLVTGLSGIPSAEAFGSGGKVLMVIVGYFGIPSAEAFGKSGTITFASGFNLYIRQRERKTSLMANTMTVNIDLTGHSSASFMLQSQRYRPQPGDEVVYLYQGRRLFAGFIQQTVEEAFPFTQFVKISCTCVDYKSICDTRVYSKTWRGPTMDLVTVVKDIVAVGLSSEGITYDGDETSSIDAARLEFADDTVTACLDRVCAAWGYDWWIDNYRQLHVERTRWQVAPYVLRDNVLGDQTWRNMKVTRTEAQLRNRQGARTAIPVSGQRQNTFTGQADYNYTLSYPVTGKPTVAVNGDEKIVVLFSDRSLQPYDFTYLLNSNIVSQNPSQAAYTGSDTVIITAPSANLDVAWTEDSAAIARRAQRVGGSGIVEVVTTARNIRDQAAALTFNSQMLNRYGSMQEVEFESDLVGWEVGQIVQAAVRVPRLSGMLQIRALSIREIDVTFPRYAVKCQSPVLPAINGITVTDNGDGTYGVQIDTDPNGLGKGTIDLSGVDDGGGGVDILSIDAVDQGGYWELTLVLETWPGIFAGDPVRTSNVKIEADGGFGVSFGQPVLAINGKWNVHTVSPPSFRGLGNGGSLTIRTIFDDNPPVDFTGFKYLNPGDGRLEGVQQSGQLDGTWTIDDGGGSGVHIVALTATDHTTYWELLFTLDIWSGTLAGESIHTSNIIIDADGGEGISFGQPVLRINGTWSVQVVDQANLQLTVQTNHDGNPDVDFSGLVYKNSPLGLVGGAPPYIGPKISFTTGQTCHILSVELIDGGDGLTWTVKLLLDQFPIRVGSGGLNEAMVAGDEFRVSGMESAFPGITSSSQVPGLTPAQKQALTDALGKSLNGSWISSAVGADPEMSVTFVTNTLDNDPRYLLGFTYTNAPKADFSVSAQNGNPGVDLRRIAGSGAGGGTVHTGQNDLEETNLRIAAINNITGEITTTDDHHFTTSYPDYHGSVVAIFGVLQPLRINNGICRIVVTGTNTFIDKEVDLLALAFDPAFDFNEGHGWVTETKDRINLASGPDDALKNVFGVTAGNSSNTIDKATFILANTVPGLPTRPLQVGDNQTNPWVAQKDLSVVDSVSAVIGTPPLGGPITIDIKQNGTSIFPGGGLLTIPEGQTEVVRVTDFANTPQVVNKDDKFTVDVVSAPNAVGQFPGCNAVVNMVTRG